MRGLVEKYALRRLARDWLPAVLAQRTKRPYRAPAAAALVHPSGGAEWARRLLSRDAVDSVGVFAGDRVTKLVERAAAAPAAVSESDSMVLMGIASTQVLHEAFVGASVPARADDVFIAVLP